MEEVNRSTDKPAIKRFASNLFTAVTKSGKKRTYERNRRGMRAAMHDSGTLAGHTRRSAARVKVHKPTAAELAAWAEWKAEQKANKAVRNG